MAVAFDAVGPSSAGASSTGSTTLSWTHTNVGSSCALVVAIAVGVSPDTGFGVTVALDPAGANTPFVSLGSIVHSNGGTAGFIALFGLPNVTSGAHTITATVSGGTPGTIEGGSVSYTGADTVSPFSAQQSATGTGASPSITFTGSTSGNMVTAGLANGNSITSMSAGTSRWIRNVDVNSAAGNAAGGDIAGGGSVVLTWSVTDDWFGIAAVEVKVPAAGAPVLVPARPRTAHRRVTWRRRGDQVTPVPPQVTPPPPPKFVTDPGRRAFRGLMARRGRRAVPVPPQVTPPAPPKLVQTPGRHMLRGLLWRRGRIAAVPAPQSIPPPPTRPHRTFTGLRRAKAVTPVPPQVAPTPPPKYPLWPARVHRTLLARWRSKTPTPVPAQVAIPPGQLTYIFRPPTTEGPRIPPMIEAGHFPTGGPRARLGAFTHGTPVGITVLKEGGVFVQVTNPLDTRLAAAERVYMGGYEYTVTGQEAVDLLNAGYVLDPI